MEMKSLLFAAVLFALPAYAAGMSVDEAWNIYEMEGDWPRCQLGTAYDGGPKLSEKEIKDACNRFEAAMNTLLQAGLIKE
jgi:hypothetical protein